MTTTYTRTLARRILLSFLALIIILSVVTLFVRNSISQKLEGISKLSDEIENNQSKPEHALLLLQQAENDFQESLINADSTKNAHYKIKLTQVFDEIDNMLKEKVQVSNLNGTQRDRIKYWYDEKLVLSEKFYSLKHNFDSLLTVYADLNLRAARDSLPINTTLQSNKNDVKINSDTVRKAGQKKGLIKRIREAIVNKDGNSKAVVEIRHNRNTRQTYLNTQRVIMQNEIAYNTKLKQLQQQNVQLLAIQGSLTALNNDIDHIITDIERINYKMADEFRNTILTSYRDRNVLLNKLFLAALFLMLMFAILLIIFIDRLNRSELRLRGEIEKIDRATVKLASANESLERALAVKRKLISIISHDLIGSLHSIINTLKFITDTNMDVSQQKSVLDEMSLSIKQLAVYADDIITWIQFRQQDENIAIDVTSFELYKLIIEKWKILALRAKMKEIELAIQIDENCEITTDRKIMGIIIYNILRNAVKFTENGLITITTSRENNIITMLFADTGIGFPDKLILDYNADRTNHINSQEGTKSELGKGMGLIIIKDLAKHINASVIIGNNKTMGAFVSVSIPFFQQSLHKS